MKVSARCGGIKIEISPDPISLRPGRELIKNMAINHKKLDTSFNKTGLKYEAINWQFFINPKREGAESGRKYITLITGKKKLLAVYGIPTDLYPISLRRFSLTTRSHTTG